MMGCEITTGLVSFGVVDENSKFVPLKDMEGNNVSWKHLRQTRKSRDEKCSTNLSKSTLNSLLTPHVIKLKKFNVNITDAVFDTIYKSAIDDRGAMNLVMVATASDGQPVIIEVGNILASGEVLLHEGIDVDGVYWRSNHQTLYENGTLLHHHQTGTTSNTGNTKILFGSMTRDGLVNELPHVDGKPVDLNLLRKINIRRQTNKQPLLLPKRKPFLDDVREFFDSTFSRLYNRENKQKRSEHIHDRLNYGQIIAKLRYFLSLSNTVASCGQNKDDDIENLLQQMFRDLSLQKDIEEMLLQLSIQQNYNNVYILMLDKYKCYLDAIKYNNN